MMYYSAAEYWFYKALEKEMNTNDLEVLTMFDIPAFNECLEMYEWGFLFRMEQIKNDHSQAV